MKTETKAVHTQFQSSDAYGALSMPVYHTVAYGFEDTKNINNDTCCIFVEIISNPHMEVVDMRQLSDIAHRAAYTMDLKLTPQRYRPSK